MTLARVQAAVDQEAAFLREFFDEIGIDIRDEKTRQFATFMCRNARILTGNHDDFLLFLGGLSQLLETTR